MIWVLLRWASLRVAVGICNLGIVSDVVAFLPVQYQFELSTAMYITYLSKLFPFVLHVQGLFAPLFANDLGYLGVRESWVLRNDLGLMMLAIKDESYKENDPGSAKCSWLLQGSTKTWSLEDANGRLFKGHNIWTQTYHFWALGSWDPVDINKLALEPRFEVRRVEHCQDQGLRWVERWRRRY